MVQGKRRRRESDASSSTPDPSLSPSSSAAGDVDRLTQLPDVLRLHILSLLPFKFAIRTGTLSKAWRNIWRSRWPQNALINISPDPSLPHSELVSLVDDFFSRRRCARIDCLQIKYSSSALQIPDIKRWLSYAASCSVSDVYLDLSPTPSSSNTTSRRGARAAAAAAAAHILGFNFRSSSLTRLTLRGFRFTSSPMLSKSLEILNLWEIYISSASLRRILVDCPVLRSLSIRRCQGLTKVVVPGPALIRLTRLTVVDCREVNEISVSSRGLRSFRFSGPLLKTYRIQTARMLEDVYISCGIDVPVLSPRHWVKPLSGLASLKVLTVCSVTLQCIAALGAREKVGFDMFQNLVELQLLMAMMAECNLSDIYGFFKYCPCPSLEKLFLELPLSACDPSMSIEIDEFPKEEPPEGCFSNLKVVKMNGFKGHLNEIELAGVLLKTSGNLEHFSVVARGNNGEKCESSTENLLHYLSTQLYSLPKASSKVSIVLTENDTSQFRPVHYQV